jgi:hypothetical protein
MSDKIRTRTEPEAMCPAALDDRHQVSAQRADRKPRRMRLRKWLASALTAGVLATVGLIATDTSEAWADRPCSWRKPKLYVLNVEEHWGGDVTHVTVLNCHPRKRRATIDVARMPDPDCRKIPFGETRKFVFISRFGYASLRGPKFC